MKRRPQNEAPVAVGVKKLRCAVYTRKSTEEGLDQEYNTLGLYHEPASGRMAAGSRSL